VVINVPVITKDVSPTYNRKPYEGRSSRYESKTETVSLMYTDCSINLDEQVAMGDPQGVDASCARAAESAWRGALLSLEKAAFNGVMDGTDCIFKGFNQSIPDSNTVDAGGTGETTDAYIVNDSAVSLFVAGGDKFSVGDIVKSQVSDENGKIYWAWGQNLSWYAGLCAVNTFGIARVKNISKDRKLTDDLIFEAMSKLDASYPPTAIYLSTTGVRHLQISRSQTSITGAAAPIPQEVSGCPVFVSSAINVL
jgi:hypothetical protein